MKVADSILDWLANGDKLDECYVKKYIGSWDNIALQKWYFLSCSQVKHITN